jgi:hypothetical protein
MSDSQQQVEDAGAKAIKAVAEALEILAKPWAKRVDTAERHAGLAGVLWDLAHEAARALGAYDEDAQDWRFARIEDEGNRLTVIRLVQAIEEYDKLAARDRNEAPS